MLGRGNLMNGWSAYLQGVAVSAKLRGTTVWSGVGKAEGLATFRDSFRYPTY